MNGKFCLSLQSQSLIVLLQSTCRHPQRISPFVLAVLKFPVGDKNKKQMPFSKSVWTCIVSVFYSLPIRIRAFFFFSLFLVFFASGYVLARVTEIINIKRVVSIRKRIQGRKSILLGNVYRNTSPVFQLELGKNECGRPPRYVCSVALDSLQLLTTLFCAIRRKNPLAELTDLRQF